MTVFCTDSNNTSSTSLSTLLTNCDSNVKQGNILDFRGVFSQDKENNLLSRACGIATSAGNVYIQNSDGSYSINPSIPDSKDQTTFYNFWNNSQQVEDFTNAFADLFSGAFTTAVEGQSSVADGIITNYYPPLNALIQDLLYYFLCTSINGSIPTLNKNDPNAGTFNNWRYFLVNARGTASNYTCTYCLQDYLLPAVGTKGASSAGKIARQLLSNNPFLRRWCGCCLPQTKSYSYNNVDYNFLNPFNNDAVDYPLQCEPICNNPGYTAFDSITDNINNIPLINGDNKFVNAPVKTDPNLLDYSVSICSDTICVIDNIAINTAASQGKGVNFNQVCPGCKDNIGKCICYSYGKDVYDKMSAGNSGMQDPITFKQYCPNALCFQEQVDGSYKEVKCNTVSPANTGKDDIFNHTGTGIFDDFQDANIYGVDTWLFPISLLAVFIILFLGAIYVTVYRNRLIPRKRHENQRE